jgi:hypothetical protein
LSGRRSSKIPRQPSEIVARRCNLAPPATSDENASYRKRKDACRRAVSLYRPGTAVCCGASSAISTAMNETPNEDLDLRRTVLQSLLGSMGESTQIKSPFNCDYGWNIHVGRNSFINYGCVFLDCNSIRIGDDAQIGPGVHIYTALHPLDAHATQWTRGCKTRDHWRQRLARRIVCDLPQREHRRQHCRGRWECCCPEPTRECPGSRESMQGDSRSFLTYTCPIPTKLRGHEDYKRALPRDFVDAYDERKPDIVRSLHYSTT